MTTWNELPAHLISKVRSDSVTPASALPCCEPIMKYKNKITEVDGIRFDSEKECDKGHWIDITFDASMCSVCQTTQEYETKYCPECGAKMDGDNNVK